jgi:phosphonate transport system permease protein
VNGADALAHALAHRRRLRREFGLAAATASALVLWSKWGTGFDAWKLIAGAPQVQDLLGRMLPPDLSVLQSLGRPLLETLQMAAVGTATSMVLALPLACLAAANTAPHPALIPPVRTLLTTLRTIPELVYALLLVSAVGLGPFPGVLALTLHATGGLGKFYAESLESVNPTVMEAIEATGADRFKVVWFGVLPSAFPLILSNTLSYWEYNSRASAILGLVGAGGIGFTFVTAMQAFEYREATTSLVLIVIVLTLIDRISAWLRARVI